MGRDASGRRIVFAALAAAGVATGLLGAVAALVARSTRATERAHPPLGSFVDVEGARLHYIAGGSGSPVVLIHGNVVTAEDWMTSGVFDRLATRHRVVAFDRPGYGHSTRSRRSRWTPAEQAAALHEAFASLGIERPAIVAHSWGTLVALALALDHPDDVARLVLCSGYFYPSFRPDAALAGIAALPLVGDVLRYTVWPVLGVVASPLLIAQMFAPRFAPKRFVASGLALSSRPSQLRASAQDALRMVPGARALSARYGELRVPVDAIAGSNDLVVDPEQSRRFAREAGGRAHVTFGTGHMVHYAIPDNVTDAVDTTRQPSR